MRFLLCVVTPGREPAYFPPLCFGIGNQLLLLSRFTGLCVDRRCSSLEHITTGSALRIFPLSSPMTDEVKCAFMLRLSY